MSPRKSAAGRKPKKENLDSYRGRFAANLRKLREKKFETIDDFVDALGVTGLESTRQTVSSWETGRRIPTIDALPAIATTLHVSIRLLIPTE